MLVIETLATLLSNLVRVAYVKKKLKNVIRFKYVIARIVHLPSTKWCLDGIP